VSAAEEQRKKADEEEKGKDFSFPTKPKKFPNTGMVKEKVFEPFFNFSPSHRFDELDNKCR